jgi:predicted permease
VNYFRTMGIAVLQGRDFTTQDDAATPRVVVVNDAFAKRHFPGKEALGKRLRFGGATAPWLEIVGVVADSKYSTLQEAPVAMTYVPLLQNHESGVTLHVRSAGNAAPLIPAVRNLVAGMEPNLPGADVRLMSDVLKLSLYTARAGARLLTAFGALALLLASVGLYGVMSYAVSRRTRELGLRMALGARAGDVRTQIVREGLTLAISGIVVGVAVAAALTGLISRFLFGISATDPATFVAIPAVLLAISAVACYVPARRVTRLDPGKALRQD